jgi:hypothetical protein
MPTDVEERNNCGGCYTATIMVEAAEPSERKLHLATLPLERDVFLRTLIHHLAGVLQEIVGLKEAEGFVTIVGQRIGDQIDKMYRAALEVPQLSAKQVGEVCVDLKRRIQGEFRIVEQTDEKIVFENRSE